MTIKLEDYARIFNRTTELDIARPNIDGVIWHDDVQGISEAMRNTGIDEFTISLNSLSLLETLDLFKAQGIVVKDVVKINSLTKDFKTGEPMKVPAILMKVM